MRSTGVGPWKNRLHDLYTQYAHLDEIHDGLELLLVQHACAFDDEWYYWLAKTTARQVVLRRPLWMDEPEKRGKFAEAGDNRGWLKDVPGMRRGTKGQLVQRKLVS